MVQTETSSLIPKGNASKSSNTNACPSIDEDPKQTLKESGDAQSKCYHFIRNTLLVPVMDETGDLDAVVKGTIVILGFGVILGMLFPNGDGLEKQWYPYLSSALGYSYFLAWTCSYIPQILQNFRRKDTNGMSLDMYMLDFVGMCCYSVFNICFLWLSPIKKAYALTHNGKPNMVALNDAVFAVYSVALGLATMCQAHYYNGFGPAQLSNLTKIVIGGLALFCAAYAFMIIFAETLFSTDAAEEKGTLLSYLNWLDFLYVVSVVKVTMSTCMYIPQVILNSRRQSTDGFNIWNIILDFIGAIGSILQLVFDCWYFEDWTGITGDLAKFLLGFVTLFFDTTLLVQHYVLYPHNAGKSLSGTDHSSVVSIDV